MIKSRMYLLFSTPHAKALAFIINEHFVSCGSQSAEWKIVRLDADTLKPIQDQCLETSLIQFEITPSGSGEDFQMWRMYFQYITFFLPLEKSVALHLPFPKFGLN